MFEHDLERVKQAIDVCETVSREEVSYFLQPEKLGRFLAAVQVAGIELQTVAETMEKEIAEDYERGAILDAKIEEYHKELAA